MDIIATSQDIDNIYAILDNSEKFEIDEDMGTYKMISIDGKTLYPVYLTTWYYINPAVIGIIFNGERPSKTHRKIVTDFKDYDTV